jgi:serine/threonine-protein kinase RsbW
VLLFVLVAAGYAFGYKLAQNWFSAPGQGASFFPPAGLTLAALVLVARRRWPVVLAAAAGTEIVLDTSNGTGLVPSLGYALANTAEPLVGALLLTTIVVGTVDLSRTRHLGWFLGCAVALAPVVGAVVAATTFVYVDGHSGWSRFAFEWWSGDSLGVLVVGSALLSLVLFRRTRRRRAVEGAVLAMAAVLSAILVFNLGSFELVYLPVALLIVLAFRAGTTIVAVTGALVAFASAGITAESEDFWRSLDVSPANRILYLQLALAILLASVLALAAEIAERERIAVSLARTESERAAAIELAALAASERAALQRTERLQALTGSLAASVSVTDVVEAVAEHGISVLEGAAGFVALPTGTKAFDIVSSRGYADDVIASWSPLPDDVAALLSHAAERQQIEFVGPLAADTEPIPLAAYGGSAAVAPLIGTDGHLLGLVYVAFHGRRTFSDEDHAMLQAVARQGAQALERALSFEQEHAARKRAELLERHAGRLAAASSMEEIAETTTAALEDAGLAIARVELPDGPEGTRIRIAAAAGVPDDVVAAFLPDYPLEAETPAAEAIRTGAPVDLPTRADYSVLLPTTAGLLPPGVEAVFAVPLRTADGKLLGAVSGGAAEPGWFTPARKALVLGLAEQAGLALERAQLKVETDAAAADVTLLASLSDLLVRSTQARERAHALVAALCSSRVELAVIHLLDEAGHPEVFERASSSPTDVDDSVLAALASRAIAEQQPADGKADGLELRSVALRARNRPLGALTVGASAERVGISSILLPRIAFRAALAIDNALLYERERDVSHALQLGLLGSEPQGTSKTTVASAYRPGTETLEVGGDWYDAFELPGGRVALLVGDVVGHGLDAAVAMGQLRGAVRALAPLGPPSTVLERLDRLIDTLPEAAMATLAYGELDLEAGTLVYACAGHPPPLLVPAEGEPQLLWDGRSTPLGSSFEVGRPQATQPFEPGDTIVLYTDGLVERRTDGISAGLDVLLGAAGRVRPAEPAQLVEQILAACLSTEEQEDDVCVLAVRRVSARFAYAFPAAPAEVAGMRHALSTWLESVGAAPERARDIVLAASEAAANAAEHAYGFDGVGIVRVEAWIEREDVVVSVSDGGAWRDPDPASERGRGHTIIEALMHDVTIDRGDDGTRVRMRVPTREEVAV